MMTQHRKKISSIMIFILVINFIHLDTIKCVDSMFAANTAKACVAAVAENMQPDFCWKRGADAGIIPQNCPLGYFRFLALCYKNPRPDYKFVIGVCWKWPDSYIPESLTNFDSRVGCEDGYYKVGALCYRDCGNIGMYNCGIGACSASSEGCGGAILKMGLDVVMGVASFVSFVLSGGTSAAASTGARTAGTQAVKKTAKETMKKGFMKVKTAFSKEFFDKSVQKYRKAFIQNLKDIPAGKSAEWVSTNFCDPVWKGMADKFQKQSEPSTNDPDKMLKSFDVFGVGDITTKCGNGDAVGCAQSVMNTASNFDPTGILSIAATFVQPICDVPATPKPIVDIKQIFNKPKAACPMCTTLSNTYDKGDKGVWNIAPHDISCPEGTFINSLSFTEVDDINLRSEYRCIKPTYPAYGNPAICIVRNSHKTQVSTANTIDKDGGQVNKLSELNVDCNMPYYYLNGLKIKWNPDDRLMWYEYTCCYQNNMEDTLYPFYTTKGDVVAMRWNLDDFLLVDNIDGGEKGAIASFKMIVENGPKYDKNVMYTGGPPKMQYFYKIGWMDYELTDSTYYSKSTQWDKDGGNEIWYMDRHFMYCDADSAMRGFQLELSGSSIRFNYQCMKTIRISNDCRTYLTDYTPCDMNPNVAVSYLKYHKAHCKAGELFRGWNFMRRRSDNYIAIQYFCCKAKFTNTYVNRTDRSTMSSGSYKTLAQQKFFLGPDEALVGIQLEELKQTNEMDWAYVSAVLSK